VKITWCGDIDGYRTCADCAVRQPFAPLRYIHATLG
jgi:hypothetical protein